MAVPDTSKAPNGLNVVEPAQYYDGIVIAQGTVYPPGKAIMNMTAAAAGITVTTKGGNSLAIVSVPAGGIVPISITAATTVTATTFVLLY